VREHQQLAGPEVRLDVLLVDGLLRRVRHQEHDHIRVGDGLGDAGDPQLRRLGQRPALGALRQPDDHVEPGIAQVQRVGVALAAIPDDRHHLALEGRRIDVVVVVHARRHLGDPRFIA
jgi:hypothetical protein